MQTWQNYLKGDPLPWLLEPENPSIRYWTLRDLLHQPAGDLEVQQARAAVDRQPLVQELFSLQNPKGYWGEETKPHTAQGSSGVLNLLYALGATPNERTAAGCDSFLENCQHESGGFSMTRKIRSGIFPCTTSTHLPFLVYFGLGDDPRVQAAFAFLIEELSTRDALDCGRYQHQECLWGAISSLDGLAALPASLRSVESKGVIQLLADALLSEVYDFAGEHKRWLTFGVPRGWDLLSALKALAIHGYSGEARFTPLLKLFLECQDPRGRWPCGSVSRTWPLEKRNQPSKWVTLDALRLLSQIN